jgi:DNA-directed RNA polymerase specialized sigma24 family protein
MTAHCQKFIFGPFEMVVVETDQREAQKMQDAFELHRRHVYGLAYWVAGTEPAAEELMGRVFRRVFLRSSTPSIEMLDRALVREVHEHTPIGRLTLPVVPVETVRNIRSRMLRIDLERAVLRLPVTERLAYLLRDAEWYDHARIASLLGITEAESHRAVHTARLRICELIANGFV